MLLSLQSLFSQYNVHEETFIKMYTNLLIQTVAIYTVYISVYTERTN